MERMNQWSSLDILLRIESGINLAVFDISALALQAAADSFLSFHNKEGDSHGSSNDCPLESIHGSHAKQDTVEAWCITDDQLQRNKWTQGIPTVFVAAEDTRVQT